MKYFNKKMQLNANAKKTLKDIITLSEETLKNDYLDYYRYRNDQINIFLFNIELLKDKAKHLFIHDAFASDVEGIIEDLEFIHKAEFNIDACNKNKINNINFRIASDKAFKYIVDSINIKKRLNNIINEYKEIMEV